MSFKFNIKEVVEKEIYYGTYCIYVLGGHHIETNPNFYVQIINVQTNEEIQLTEKILKAKDFKFGRKAIRFYTFEIGAYGKFRISVHNYEDIVVKDSMLEIFSFPFSIIVKVHSLIFGRSTDKVPLETIEIGID